MTDSIELVERSDSVAVSGSDAFREQSTSRRAGTLLETIRDETERITRREVDEGIRRLERADELTDRQRDTVEEMADAIREGLFDAPTTRLVAAAVTQDGETVNAMQRLFVSNAGSEERSSRADSPESRAAVSDGD